jgi:hypothetical protein
VTWDRLRSSYDTVAARYEATFVDELAGKPGTGSGWRPSPAPSGTRSWSWGAGRGRSVGPSPTTVVG